MQCVRRDVFYCPLRLPFAEAAQTFMLALGGDSRRPMSKPILSLQLFSMRSLGSLDEQLSVAARAGFGHVELLEGHLLKPCELKGLLSRHGLSSPTAHLGLSALRADRSRIVDACHQCGIGQLFVQGVSAEHMPETTDGWRRAGAELGSLAEKLKINGITLGYHNKMAGFRALPAGRCGFEVLFNAARGSPLVWQADIAWISRAGVDPAEWLKRYASVLVSAHVKDQAPEGENEEEDGWSDVGAGVLLWPSLWREAVKYGARTLVVEHDNPSHPLEFATRSLTYLRRFLQ